MQTHEQYLKSKALFASHVETYTRLYFHLKAQRSIMQSIHDQAQLKLQTIEHQKKQIISHQENSNESSPNKSNLFHPKYHNEIEDLNLDQLNINETVLKDFISTIESILNCDIKTVIFEACNFITKTRNDSLPTCSPDILKLINIFSNACVAFVKFPTSLLANFKNAADLNSPNTNQSSKKKANTIIDAPISAYYENYDENTVYDDMDEASSKSYDSENTGNESNLHEADSIINPLSSSTDSSAQNQNIPNRRTHRSHTQKPKHHHHCHHHQKNAETTVVCRLCNEHIPINLFAEHIKSCAIAFKSELKIQDINQMLLNEYNLIETQYLSCEWPGEREMAVNVIIPMLHLCILLMRAQDIEENTNDSLEELENIEENILQIPFTEEDTLQNESRKDKYRNKILFNDATVHGNVQMNRSSVNPDMFHSYTKLDMHHKHDNFKNDQQNDNNEGVTHLANQIKTHSSNRIAAQKKKSTETINNDDSTYDGSVSNQDNDSEDQSSIRENTNETNDTSESIDNLAELTESTNESAGDTNKTSDYSSDYSVSQSSKINSAEKFPKDGQITSIIKDSIKLLREKINLTVVLCAASNVLRNTRLSGSDKITTANTVRIIDFDFIKLISAGAYARVFLAKMRSTGDIYAIKVTPKSSCTHKNEVLRIITEKNIMLKINHPYIVTFYYSFIGLNNLYLVMEYLPGGDLYSLLQNVGSFDEDTAKLYIYEILLALKFLHTNGIIHRDLKPDNILVAKDGKIKLTDFGLSHLGLIDRRNSEELGDTEETKIVGTPDYIAPEILMQKKHSYTCDYWSLGCMLYEFLIGVPPFHADTEEETFKNILSGQYDLSADVGVEDFTQDAIDLIKKLLVLDPNQRLGAESVDDILHHPWFKGVDPEKEDPPFVPELNSQYDTTYFQQRYSFKEDDSDIIEDINDDKEKQKKQHQDLGEKRNQSMISMNIAETHDSNDHGVSRSAERINTPRSLKDEIENESNGSKIIDDYQSSTHNALSKSNEKNRSSTSSIETQLSYLHQFANNVHASHSRSRSSLEGVELNDIDINDSPLSNSITPNALSNYAAVGVDQIIQKNEEILSESQQQCKGQKAHRAKSFQIQDIVPHSFGDLNIDFDVDMDNRNKMQALASSLSTDDNDVAIAANHNANEIKADEINPLETTEKNETNSIKDRITNSEKNEVNSIKEISAKSEKNEVSSDKEKHAKFAKDDSKPAKTVKLPEINETLPIQLQLPPKSQSEQMLASPRKEENLEKQQVTPSGKTKAFYLSSFSSSPITKIVGIDDEQKETKPETEPMNENENDASKFSNNLNIRAYKSDISLALLKDGEIIEPVEKLANSSEQDLVELQNEDGTKELNPLAAFTQSMRKSSKSFFIFDSPYILKRMKQLPEDPRAALRRIRAKHRKNVQKLSTMLNEKLSTFHLYE